MLEMNLEKVILRVTRHEIEDGLRTKATIDSVKLSEKMHEYLTKMGYTNAHIYNIIVHLLTSGKVRVDFRNYTERLELPGTEMYSKVQAITLLDDFIEQNFQQGKAVNLTQRIVIQQPRP